jgi:glycosyltransferase involved in cell wall biosynthesis
MQKPYVTIVIPAKNEADSLISLIPQIKAIVPQCEILIINDGSTDNTAYVSTEAGAKVISHPYSMGNGAAVKTGARSAKGDVIVFMDADGQHDPEDIPMLLEKLNEGFYMVVGARHAQSQASLFRLFGNGFYNRLATYMTGYKIEDLTCGFRAVRAVRFRKFLYLLPNGFSYPTTSTMAFFRSGFPVAYVPIHAGRRNGKSHINMLKDGVRFFIIILRIGALFSPMRLFLPLSVAVFFTGISYYAYTFFTASRFTNMSGVLFLSSLIIFLIGIISEQISSLHYKASEDQ